MDNKVNNSSTKSAKPQQSSADLARASRASARRPQVLDLRPGHIKAVAAMKANADRQVKGKSIDISGVSRRRATTTAPKPTTKQPASSTIAKSGATNSTPAKPSSTSNTKKARKVATNPRGKNSKLRPDKLTSKARRQVDKTIATISKHGKRFIIDRWDHIRMARRSVVIWLSLILLLIIGSFIQTIYYNNQNTVTASVSGGTYAEGVVDKLTTISPLYATTNTEEAASKLVYPGLLSYDDANKLHGDLAESWSVDESGQIWTVKLKPNLVWSDGQTLTSDDVATTVQLMKDPAINATLAGSWQNIEVDPVDEQTVVFKLASPLMSFDTTLTFGILPAHSLSDKSAIDIASLFSESPQDIPVSGPFLLDKVETTTDHSVWQFTPNDKYYGDQVKLDKLTIRTYNDNASLANGLKRGEVNAISDVNVSDVAQFDSNKFKTIQLKTANGVFAIFNNDSQVVGSSAVRDALRLGLDRQVIRNKLSESNSQLNTPTNLETPIATGVYNQIDQLKQPDYNQQAAKEALDNSGWTLKDGQKYRTNSDGQELALQLVTIAGTNYEEVANQIAEQWRQLGVNVTVEAANASIAQQNYLMPRNYDVLVYQMHLGSDPDMFAYWSSTQTDQTGLNLANYRSRKAEIALSAGRTNTNASAREARYVAFVNQWLQDNPAIALYQPSFLYVMDKDVNTLRSGDSLIDASNRFQNVSTWTVRTAPVMQTP